MTTLENLNGYWPRSIPEPRYRAPLVPAPAVVIAASVVFLAGLAGAGIGFVFYRIAEHFGSTHG